jgi:hypothetical protein
VGDKRNKMSKHVFWQALIVALIIFNFGIFLGYMLESSRVGKVKSLYADSELDLLDVRIQSDLFNFWPDLNCEDAIEKNVQFADRIYEEGKILDRLENAQRVTEGIKLQHKKYDLLRTLFWINSIKIKERCQADFVNVVYFYKYNDPSVNQKAMQNVFSNVLEDLKKEAGGGIMLIPIAADNNITSVDLLLKTYDIEKFPSILIDEEVKISELISARELGEIVEDRKNI